MYNGFTLVHSIHEIKCAKNLMMIKKGGIFALSLLCFNKIAAFLRTAHLMSRQSSVLINQAQVNKDILKYM